MKTTIFIALMTVQLLVVVRHGLSKTACLTIPCRLSKHAEFEKLAASIDAVCKIWRCEQGS